MHKHVKFAVVTAIVFLALDTRNALAEVRTFQIDSNQSALSIYQSKLANFPCDEQSDRSLQTRFEGFIRVEILEDRVRFPGGSLFSARNQSTPQAPGLGGADGAAPANYGIQLRMPSGVGRAAVRDFAFDITGETILDSGNLGCLCSRSLTATIISGTVDYSIDLANLSQSGTISLVGLPVELSGTVDVIGAPYPEPPRLFQLLPSLTVTFTTIAANDSRFDFDFGGITIVPEPSTMAIAIAVVGIASLRRRR